MKKVLVIIIPIIVISIGIILFSQSDKKSNSVANTQSTESLNQVAEISHGHGLALTSDNKLYIATHYGLLLLENDMDLSKVGQATDDYMGFTAHPTESNVFFSSGHPSTGGNIGFQKSEDGGLTWNKVSDGLNGPVDFHAMTVSPANPNLVYGSYQGAVQRSTDEGKTWQKFPVNFTIVNLVADPIDENKVYAASPQGLFRSKDKGQTWDALLEVGASGFISTVAIDPANPQHLLAHADDMGGLISSEDGGKVWRNLDLSFNGETPLYIAFNRNLQNIGYILTEKNSIYKTTDNAATWSKIR